MWHQADMMFERFRNLLVKAVKKGLTKSGITPLIKYFFSSGDYIAETTLVTESTRINNESKLELFKKEKIKYYQQISVMDSRTTKICVRRDLKITKVSDAVLGVNLPALHIGCRSTIRSYEINKRY